MPEAWIHFAIAFLVQFLFFVVHAWYEKKLPDAARILVRGVLTGIVLGLFFDLILGKFLGLWSYALGFGSFFLILNAALVYGLFAANTLLMQQARLLHFFVWTLLMGAVLDITNLFFPVWTWNFSFLSIKFLTVFLLGNFATALLVALVWHVLFRRRFLFMENLLKK